MTAYGTQKLGHNGAKADYYIESTPLPTCTVECDLGVHIQDSLKVSQQCTKAANTANRILGMVYKTFSNKSSELVETLNKSLPVRSHLD